MPSLSREDNKSTRNKLERKRERKKERKWKSDAVKFCGISARDKLEVTKTRQIINRFWSIFEEFQELRVGSSCLSRNCFHLFPRIHRYNDTSSFAQVKTPNDNYAKIIMIYELAVLSSSKIVE